MPLSELAEHAEKLRSSVAPEGDRHARASPIVRTSSLLRSSVAPEGDRHCLARLGVDLLGGVAILGRPGGRPPPGRWAAEAARREELRSSVAPEGDRH